MCNNYIHAAVCGKYKATGGQVVKCEHFAQERRGRWKEVQALTPYCPNCGARMEGE